MEAPAALAAAALAEVSTRERSARPPPPDWASRISAAAEPRGRASGTAARAEFGGGGGASNGKNAAPGGGSGSGGAGGFGGGGGAGAAASSQFSGGSGGLGGFGGGNGAPNGAGGGGGLAAGGDIFVQSGGTLTISGGTLAEGALRGGGAGGADASAGGAYGAGLFLQGDETITLGAGQSSGQTTRIGGDIADQSGAGLNGSSAGAGGLLIAGSGTVVLSGNNSFTGGVTIAGGTLDLASTTAAGTGPITFAGGALEFAPADQTNDSMDDFVGSDSITIAGFRSTSESFDADDVLTLSNSSTRVEIAFGAGGPTQLSDLTFTQDNTGDTVITDDIPCFCPGTSILTDQGERPVETLEIGNRVITASGEARAIRWIGRRRFDLAEIALGRQSLYPVRIAAGALGEGSPRRDLFVSPGHAMWLDGWLVSAADLVNGATITRPERSQPIEYIHVELDAHDIIFAEGSATESYSDHDNRHMFADARGYAARPSKSGHNDCAPRARGGEALLAIRAKLAARAEQLGFARTLERAVHLLVDGRPVRTRQVEDGLRYAFDIPAGARSIRLISRVGAPTDMEGSTDRRVLGLPVARLVARSFEGEFELAHDDASLIQGFHYAETTHRWTLGDAALPNALVERFANCGGVLEVHAIATALPVWTQARATAA